MNYVFNCMMLFITFNQTLLLYYILKNII